jgi:hypothetical protein
MKHKWGDIRMARHKMNLLVVIVSVKDHNLQVSNV